MIRSRWPSGWSSFPIRPVDFGAGDWRSEPIRSGPRAFLGIVGQRPIVGYAYSASFVGVLCHGPAQQMDDLLIDGKSITEAGEQRIPTTDLDTFTPEVTFETVSTNFPNTTFQGYSPTQFAGRGEASYQVPYLFGKSELSGVVNGVAGTVVWRNGHGHGTTISELEARHSDVPAWRPFVHVYFDDCYFGNSPVLPSMHVILRRTPRNSYGLIEGSELGDSVADANPAGILWELLTDPETGCGLPEALLDRASFDALSGACSGEINRSFGLSFVVDAATPATKVIDDVLRTLDAVLTRHPVTGKIGVWLLRTGADPVYGHGDPDDLPQLNPSTVSSFQWTPPARVSTANEVRVSFIDRARKWTKNTVTLTHHALAAAAGQVITQEVEFLGCTREAMARRLVERELRAQTASLARASALCDRSPAGVLPGQWVRVNWPELGVVDRIMRVVEVDFGTLDNPAVRIDCVDDVYALPAYDATRIITEPWEPSTPVAGITPPYFESRVDQRAADADVKILLVDAQERVTLTQWRTYASRDTVPAYTTLTGGPGWTFTVDLSTTDNVIVEWRAEWTDANGTTREISDGVALSVNSTPPTAGGLTTRYEPVVAPDERIVMTDGSPLITLVISDGDLVMAEVPTP